MLSHNSGLDRSIVAVRKLEPGESMLRNENKWLRLTLSCIADAVIVTDTQGRITLMNPVAEQLTGWSQANALGRTIAEIYDIRNEDTREAVVNVAVKVMKTGVIVGLANHTVLIARDGTERPIEDSGAPIRDDAGGLVGVIVVFRDVSDRKRAEQERSVIHMREQSARKDAETANRIKDEFLATLSHELRTPLQAILGWARLLRRGRLDPSSSARAFDTILRNAKAQSQIIEDLLDVSRIISGKLSFHLRPIQLGPVISAAMETVRPAAEAKGVELEAYLNGNTAIVSGDPDRLQQVVWNLIINAIKFTPKYGRVEVRVECVDSQAQISVKDTGEGIDPEFLPHVFERFRQADSTNTRSHGGIGLGLAIVRHLVELHGGVVTATSEGKGMGSTFKVSLPILENSECAPAEPGKPVMLCANENKRLMNLRILVVDDEMDSRELAGKVLEYYGANVQTAASVQEAIKILQAVPPDVALSDLSMPGEDGFSLIRKIKCFELNSGRNIPVAALTAYARDEDRKRVLSAGFKMHLCKPIDPEALVEAVATLATARQEN
jgi:PAS domain S-box-containing protein